MGLVVSHTMEGIPFKAVPIETSGIVGKIFLRRLEMLPVLLSSSMEDKKRTPSRRSAEEDEKKNDDPEMD